MLDALLGRKFWILATLALALGFWLPGDYASLRGTTTPLLGAILLFSSLTIDLRALLRSFRRPALATRLAMVAFLKLIAIPAAAWLLTFAVAPAWAPGLLLLSAMPAGLSSIAFTELYRGDRVFALLSVAATSALAPATVPLLLGALGPEGTHLEARALAERAVYILLVIAVPFTVAQLLRRGAARFIDERPVVWRHGAILSSCLLVFVSVATNRASWGGWPLPSLAAPLLLTCLASLLFLGVSLAAGRRVPLGESIALGCGVVYVNNGLAILLAVRFFPGDGRMLLPSVLVQLPMVAAVTVVGGRSSPRTLLPIRFSARRR